MPTVLHHREMIREDECHLSENQQRFAANPGGPTRRIVSELCGVGRTAVGEYLKERMGGGRDSATGLPSGAGKKGPREVALKSETKDAETLYDSIVCRISEVHRGGRSGAERKLARYVAVGENGPMLPVVSVRAPDECFFANTKNVLTE